MTVTDDAPPAEAPGLTARQRDEQTLRRALRAGAAVGGGMAVLATAGTLLAGGDGISVGIWLTTAIVVGALVTAGWMVLALLLDLAAGETPSTRRAVWTAILFVLAFASPVLPAAMFQVAASS